MSLRKRLLRLGAVAILTPVIFLLSCQSKLIYFPNPYRAEHETLLRKAKGERLHYTTSRTGRLSSNRPRDDRGGGTVELSPNFFRDAHIQAARLTETVS